MVDYFIKGNSCSCFMIESDLRKWIFNESYIEVVGFGEESSGVIVSSENVDGGVRFSEW